MANIQINIIENGTTTLATSGCICDRNIDINVDVPTGGGGNREDFVPDSALTISGQCNYKFSNNGWNWFIDMYGDSITTSNISNADFMFSASGNLQRIPFTINMANTQCTIANMFQSCYSLIEAPHINMPMATKLNMSNLIYNCTRLRDANGLFVNEDEWGASWRSYLNTASFGGINASSIMNACSSLRSVPTWFYQLKLNPESTEFPYAGYTIYYNTFNTCYALEEILNMPVWTCKGAATSNMFTNTFSSTDRAKHITFETNEDGSPIVTKWKAQLIDLNTYVGYSGNPGHIRDYNSGISMDKEVTDDATYQALKNDPDWWTQKLEYSRYNHDSAVATINSLPDCSAYLTTAGGTNTIKFKGAMGSLTDGGAINTLTEEEIAVATAKGWTVTLA